MANALYDLGRQKFLEGSIAWLTDDIRLVLVDTADYTVNLATDAWLSDVPTIARTAVSGSFTTKTSTAGVADADDVTLSAVSGDQSEALVIYKHTGTAGTSPLIAYIDTATGLPVLPNSGDILISWSSGSDKIFRL